MDQRRLRNLQFSLSGIWFWVALLAIAWLFGVVGLGWLIKSVLVLIGLLLITPILGFFGFRWWLKRNLVEDQCPVCSTTSVGINGTQLRCPSCSEPLRVEQGHFVRLTPPGTIDVQAVEVNAKPLESAEDQK